MFTKMINILKENPRKIVFPEGSDPRILEASAKLLAEGILTPILVGDKAEIEAAAAAGNFDITGAEIIDPANYDGFEEMVDMYCELRKKKGVTPEEARKVLSASNYFGTMLVKMAKQKAYLVEQHTLQLIQYVRHYSLSKQNQATQSYLLASS